MANSRSLFSSTIYNLIVSASTVVISLCLLAEWCCASSPANYQVNGQSTAYGKQPDVDWVPIVERRSPNNLTTIVLDAFQNAQLNDRVTAEKVSRISKMLNSSLEMQEKELLEGSKKLEGLTQSVDALNHYSRSDLHSLFYLAPFLVLYLLIFAPQM